MKQIRKPSRRAPTERELQVCERLRDMRISLRLSQKEFADQVGIKRQRLASYEEGRAPLRFDLGLRICRQFIISERWLATEQGDPRLLMDLSSDHITNKIPPDTAFGKAFDEVLFKRYDELSSEQGGNIRIELQPGDNLPFIKNLFLLLVARWCSMINEEEIPAYLMRLIEVGTMLMHERFRTGTIPEVIKVTDPSGVQYLATLGDVPPDSEINDLTDVIASDNTKDVKAQWLLLKARLQKATSEKGSKSRLAEFLGLPLSSVSLWLSNSKSAREPGAETALRMLYWVERREHK